MKTYIHIIFIIFIIFYLIFLNYITTYPENTQIIQTTVSNFNYDLLLEKQPIIINDNISIDDINNIFNYLCNYKNVLINLNQSSEYINNFYINKNKYVVIYNNVDYHNTKFKVINPEDTNEDTNENTKDDKKESSVIEQKEKYLNIYIIKPNNINYDTLIKTNLYHLSNLTLDNIDNKKNIINIKLYYNNILILPYNWLWFSQKAPHYTFYSDMAYYYLA